MKNSFRRYITFFISSMIICLNACNKSKFLDAKPDQGLVIPETIDELQSIADNINIMNGIGSGVIPSFGEIGTDDYYAISFVPTPDGASLKRLYQWEDLIDPTIKFVDWDYPYRAILYANIILEGLNKIAEPDKSSNEFHNLLGSALFYRADMYYHLSQVYCAVYDQASARTDLGLPLKLSSDVSEQVRRSSLFETYQLVINDLREAANSLPEIPKYKTRPSKPAAYGALARIFLVMGSYDSAYYYSNKCLEIYNYLIDYNDNAEVNKSGSPGIRKRYNDEVIFHNNLINAAVSPLMYNNTNIRVDSTLFALYDVNDLRKSVFFGNVSNGKSFKGSYNANSVLFGGIAVDEVYLIRSECNARLGRVQEAIDDLNKLLEKRWATGLYIPLIITDQNQAIETILSERRKELIFRGLRWSDLKRLNRDGANIIVSRVVDGQSVILSPNDKRYVFLIPRDAMSFNTGWQQNLR